MSFDNIQNASLTLTLIMIVKNESRIIERCLDTVRPIIDHIVISDTGSTDDTKDIIDAYLKKYSIPGMVCEDEWKNFGHNRSKSVTNGQKWLSDHNITGSYFITIDADMLLCISDEFKKEMLVDKMSWLIQQRNSTINYYNLRVFRADLPYQCVGVTHEYWGCDSDDSPGRLDHIHIDDRGDGGCKSDKFTRDIALLTKGIEDEPDNVRYYFYLAQSYADSDDIENGLKWYQKRIDAGGWVEEIFISHKKRGELFMRKGETEKAVAEWINAYEKLPERSETLYQIVRHYRVNGKYHACLLFLKQALDVSYPKDLLLFIEHPVYEYKLLEEFSIIAYYIDKRIEGGMVGQFILLCPTIPSFVKDNIHFNSFFYMSPLSDIATIRSHRTLSIHTDEPYKSSSACFHKTDSGYEGVVRAVNYSMNNRFEYTVRDVEKIVRTKNYWIEMNDQYQTKCLYEIKCVYDDHPLRDAHIKGFEDVRICCVGNDVYGIGVHWEYGAHNHPSVVLLSFVKHNDEYIIDRIKPITYKDTICQKNWVLFSENEKLYAIYSHHPLIIIQLDTTFSGNDIVVTEKYSPYDLSRVRGSTTPVQIGTEWLMIVHDVIYKNTRKYFNRFLRYDKEWNVIGISEPFYFKQFYVEFTLSVMYDKEKETIIIPYSTCDNTTECVEIDYQSIKWIPLSISPREWLLQRLK